MVESEETKPCPTCGKDIEASKFRMHDIGCARQNYRCEKCKEAVPKSDKEQHDCENKLQELVNEAEENQEENKDDFGDKGGDVY